MTPRKLRPLPHRLLAPARSRSWFYSSVVVPLVLLPLAIALWLYFPLTLAPEVNAATAPAPEVAAAAPTPVPAPGTIKNPVDVHYQLRGYFHAGGRSEGLGGFASSSNLPRRTRKSPGRVTLQAHPARLAKFDKYDGYRVLLINGTSKEFKVDAQDSRLPMVHEAKDAQGQWQAIEYLPSSWCGNSYHDLFLPSRHYWEFAAPHYTGSFATQLRLRLDTPDGPIYSNEFAGNINPEQLVPENKQGHKPAGLMDPYED